jgi:AcrR family transcriptional regulator
MIPPTVVTRKRTVTERREPPAAERAATRSSRPGTAVQAKGRHRAEEILDAARAILVEDGYAELTTRKVAKRAGIRQSNLQYYFPAKVDLVRALFERTTGETGRLIARRLAERRMSPRQRLVWTLDQFLKSHHSPEQQIFLRELWALAAHDAEVGAVMNGFYQTWVDLGAENLLEIDPGLGRARAQRLSLLIVSLVDGLSLFHGAKGIDHPATRGIERELRCAVLAMIEG